jgi:hypothetical protein
MAAAVMRLVQRQPARRALAIGRVELVGAVCEGAGDVLARGVLLARDLGVRGAADDALGQPCPEAAVTRRRAGNCSWVSVNVREHHTRRQRR